MTKKAGYKRGTYYTHIKNPKLPIPILLKYANVLNLDFSDAIPEMNPPIIYDAVREHNIEPKTLKEAKEQISYWKEKYYSTLDKYVEIIEKKK